VQAEVERGLVGEWSDFLKLLMLDERLTKRSRRHVDSARILRSWTPPRKHLSKALYPSCCLIHPTRRPLLYKILLCFNFLRGCTSVSAFSISCLSKLPLFRDNKYSAAMAADKKA
jgi:hypothetical protein